MRVEGLRVRLGGVLVLEDITFDVVEGLNLILGPNGSGKTTTLRAIAGIYKPEGGRIELDGDIGYMPVEFADVDMTVLDVLLAGGGRHPERYLAWLKAVGLEGFEGRIFSRLSAGQKRLVLLAKALAEGRVVLLDEPTANLDPAHKALIMGILQKLKRLKVFIAASHDLDLINIADNVILLRRGRAIQMRPDEVDGEILSEVYGIPISVIELQGRRLFVPRYEALGGDAQKD